MKTIYYHLLIDASKSMSRYWDALVKQLNAHYKTTRKFEALYPIDLKRGIGVFNIENIFLDMIMQSPAILKKIKPDGRTALYDAIKTNIDFVENELLKAQSAIDTTTIFVVLTDGHENASKLYDAQQVRETIMKLQQEGNWEFVFFGADLDVNEINKILKIPHFNYHNFEKSELKSAFEELNDIVLKTLKKSTQAQ
ncbi:VWA domain-containing protein [Daejeonella sp.]|jgi:hypothetical protein|uniref:VWA domain-containing protein n=1 Tax=Daejeonella sp. TaxID=2805397 RepID=UPI0037C07B26